MSIAAGQNSYPLDPAIGVAGQRYDNGPTDIKSFVASGNIPFGSAVELVSGQVRVCQSTSSTLPLVGVALLNDTKEQAYGAAAGSGTNGTVTQYAAGDVVPVLCKGRIYALWSGTTQVQLAAPLVAHSSTGASLQGAFTDAAASTTAGSEVTASPSGVQLFGGPTGLTGVCLVELNLP